MNVAWMEAGYSPATAWAKSSSDLPGLLFSFLHGGLNNSDNFGCYTCVLDGHNFQQFVLELAFFVVVRIERVEMRACDKNRCHKVCYAIAGFELNVASNRVGRSFFSMMVASLALAG